jgi:hypothetical protein
MNDIEMKELLELTRENNKLLHKMRRGAIYGNIFRFFYWTIILGGPVIIYFYYLQPYMQQLLDAYSGAQDGVENIGNKIEQIPGLNGLLNLLGIGR